MQSVISRSGLRGGIDIDELMFNRLWAGFPPRIDRKSGKQYARQVFKRIQPSDALLEVMIEAVEMQKKSWEWRKEGGAFVPDLSAWLNGARWEDECTGC